MKKLITFLVILNIALFVRNEVQAQAINYDNTSIKITNDGGFSTTSNDIRYTISADLDDAETVKDLFPNKDFKVEAGTLTYNVQHSGSVSVPAMWDMINTFVIEQSDVGKTVKEAIQTWSINIIYGNNLLKLDTTKWNINE